MNSSQFENSISALEDIIGQLEKGELSLESALVEFEKGITLARQCQTLLKEAEQKIEFIINPTETE